MFADRPTLLFDLDGTLIDSGGDLAAAVNHILTQDGLPSLRREQVLQMLGDGAPSLVARAYAHHGAEQPSDALDRYRQHYREHCLDTTLPYPGVLEVLRQLAPNRSLAVATNKPTVFAQQMVDGLDLNKWVETVVGPECADAPKPSPGMLLTALETLGREPHEAVMIGDSPTDIEAGQKAGMATVAVSWGYRDRQLLTASGPDCLVESVEELSRLLI